VAAHRREVVAVVVVRAVLEALEVAGHEHIKMLGHFPFTLPHELAAGARRQLRELGQAA
jgi:hypothetical protein